MLILPGVKIGDGAVIATKEVVTKNISPYSIASGNPAKVVKMRFDEDIIKYLLNIQWWNWLIRKINSLSVYLASNNIMLKLQSKL